MPTSHPRLVLVIGGARSGKSAASEEMALRASSQLQTSVTYIATAEGKDGEMAERIAVHRERRPNDWRTVEEPYAVDKVLEAAADGVFLIDCLTLFISNWLLRLEQEGLSGATLEEAVLARVDALLHAAQGCNGCVVVVSNEVGQGVVPAYPLGRMFRDIAGKANQKIAAAADEVVYCVAGMRMPLKRNEQGVKGSQAAAPPSPVVAEGGAPKSSLQPPPYRFYEAPGLALQFLTRLPGPIKYMVPDERLISSMCWFPVIGGLIGLIGSLICALAQQIFPAEVTAALVVAATIMVTGNLHFDGLMDTADGLYGSYTPARRLEIMHDSRMGAHGVAAGILVTLVKWSALTALIENGAVIWLLPLVFAASRWSLVLGAYSQTPARKEGFAALYATHLKPRHLLVATAIWFAVALLVAAIAGVGNSMIAVAGANAAGVMYTVILTLIIATVTTWLLGRYLKAKLGGMTGDTLGATNELVEVTLLLVLAAVIR